MCMVFTNRVLLLMAQWYSCDCGAIKTTLVSTAAMEGWLRQLRKMSSGITASPCPIYLQKQIFYLKY